MVGVQDNRHCTHHIRSSGERGSLQFTSDLTQAYQLIAAICKEISTILSDLLITCRSICRDSFVFFFNRKRRTIFLSSSESVINLSSFRVPDAPMLIAGYIRALAISLSKTSSIFPVPLNSSKIRSSILELVSIRQVAIIVSDPPPSILRAEPKIFFGISRARISSPPDKVLPLLV